MAVSVLNTDANLSGNTIALLEVAGTATALWTFDRDPSAPFAVTASSAVVANLDADKLDGVEAASFLRSDAADIKTTGDLTLNDSIALTLGTGGDVDVEYDGTDMLVTKVVGAGDVVVSGMSLEFDDAEGVTLGTGKDATIQYDGTDLVIAPAAVGAGDIVVTAASIEFADDEGVTLGTGKDATIRYDGTDLVVAPAAVGSGDIVVTAASIEFADSEGVTLGTGKDATIQYDGTDLVIAPAAVGAGDVHVSGGSVEVDDSESFTLGTGKDATIIYDGTDLTISPAAVGSGDLVIAGASAEFADDEGVTLGTGKDATLQYDGTNVEMDTQAVGSGLLIVTGSAAISGVEIDNTATDGDPTLAFTLSGTSLFTMGVDDGDSDKFKIGTTAIGTDTALTIDGSQNVGLSTTAPVSLLDVRGPTGTGATPAGLLTLSTAELTIADNDQLGRVDFRAPLATAGTDAIVTAASIWSEANATFSASVNSADIVLATSESGSPVEHLRLDSRGTMGFGNEGTGKGRLQNESWGTVWGNNTYYNGSAWVAVATGVSSNISMDSNGGMVFRRAPSVSAGAGTTDVTNLNITSAGDVYSTAYADYYSSSTIVGWSSLTSGRRRIMYKTIGKLVFVWFHLEGTSNATTVTFTLPYTSTSIGYGGKMFGSPLTFTYNNTAAVAIQGVVQLAVNDNVATCNLSPLAGGGWTSSGVKEVAGNFMYEMA